MVRAGEMAKRVPPGPVYLNVPVETMIHAWTPPPKLRKTPEPPKVAPLPEDVENVAALIAQAKCPVIITESAGRNPETFAALIAFAELMAIPVIEGRAAAYANFPKSHPLHLGTNIAPLLNETDLALLIESRVPWYPPSNSPPNAKIVSVSENPLKEHMVYQTHGGRHLPGGRCRRILEAVDSCVEKIRRKRRQARRPPQALGGRARQAMARRKATQAKAQEADGISTALLCKTLNEVLPPETIFLDETIVHSPIIRDLLEWNAPHSFFRIPAASARVSASRSAPNLPRASVRW